MYIISPQPSPKILTEVEKDLEKSLGFINNLHISIPARMVNGTQENRSDDWHDAWSNLAFTLIGPLELALLTKDKGELGSNKKILLDLASQFLLKIREVNPNNRAIGEPQLQAIVDEMKVKIEEILGITNQNLPELEDVPERTVLKVTDILEV